MEVLRVVAERLNAAAIDYMLTGSIAMTWYAEPRQTRDIDVVVELPESKLAAVVQSFSSDFYVDFDVARAEVRRRGMFNMIHDALVVKVDMIIRKADLYSAQAFARRKHVEIVAGVGVSIISPEDLVLAKLDWAARGESDLQMRDVRNLLKSVGDLDRDYLSTWSQKLGLADLLVRAAST